MKSDSWEEYYRILYGERFQWKLFLKSWCDNTDIFIRELSFPFRKITKCTDHLHNQLLYFTDPKQHQEFPHVYLTVNAYERSETIAARRSRERPVYDSIIWNKLYWDFDVVKTVPEPQLKDYLDNGWREVERKPGGKVVIETDLMKALEEARKLWAYFRFTPTVIFSAGRGFHVYVSPDSEHPIVNDHVRIQKYQKGLNKRLEFETVDTISDNARVSRLPFTPHPRTSRFAIPVNFGELRMLATDPLEAILSESENAPVPKPIFPKEVRIPDLEAE